MVHLHIKSEYSLLRSAARVADIPKKAASLGQSAAAITDAGVLYGAPLFFREAKKNGIKPILGLETKGAGVVLLCKNTAGYKNICKIASDENQDFGIIEANGGGLIALSGGGNSGIHKMLLGGQYNEAKRTVLRLKSAVDEFYLEICDHGLREEADVFPLYLRLSEETGCELCAANDVYYTEKSDAETRELLLRIQTGTILTAKDSGSLPCDEYYIKSESEMPPLFDKYPEALANTEKIAAQCSFDFDEISGGIHLPRFTAPKNLSSAAYLSALAEKGAMRRYGEGLTPEIRERLFYELSVIDKMGFTDYFLIVWDFVKFAKQSGVPVGPGRGSGAGSLVAYCIGIMNIDPIRYGLLFERFLNPERVSLPDFDIDFGNERREEVKDYVIKKYGADCTAGIVAFGTLAAKNAVRDVVRILGLPYASGNYLSNRIPFQGTISQFRNGGKWTETDPVLIKILETAEKIEGYPKNASTHASGVVIADKPLTEYLPVIKNGGVTSTQYTMGELEALGLVKIDFLGIKAPTVIDDTAKSIRKHLPDFSDDRIPFDDKAAFEMFSSGETAGIFQFESEGITNLLRRIAPRNIEDIIAAIALFRPGPMDKIPEYLENRKNPAKIKYLHPLLCDILAETYGVAVYQEQVMKIARVMADFSYGRADLLRRAMSKKNAAIMQSEHKAFIEGAAKKGVSEKIAETVFADIEKFAGYAFNKSHAAAYAYISYKTAYLKAHFPTEFFAALLSSVAGSAEKIAYYAREMRKQRIFLLPPDILLSERKFVPEKNGEIRFGLSAVKGIGDRAADEIVRIRETSEITSCEDFCKLADFNILSRKTIEALVLAGAFDRFGKSRRQLMRYLPFYMDAADAASYRNVAGQTDFFSISGATAKTDEKQIQEFSREEINNLSLEYCGIVF
ncbi:MAG: DNA polymerase III subunit alpha [Ruminococcus sp.]|jgi:DNA polymerase-3 subunit alpha|nr:DNA polymerase III subunit alpha [Ruminococcus sp.]